MEEEDEENEDGTADAASSKMTKEISFGSDQVGSNLFRHPVAGSLHLQPYIVGSSW